MIIWSGMVLAILAVVFAWTHRAMRWGATPEEIASAGSADGWFAGVSGSRLRMTRAITIEASPETVWPWLAQNGRGAGWFSYDRIDNGGRASARHIVDWIPEPCVGDAAAIGYLRHLDRGREIVWWAPNLSFLGARTWSAWAYRLARQGDGSRLLMRVDVAAAGSARFFVLLLLPLIDGIMAVRQLRTLKERAERFGTRTEEPENPATGKPNQYQEHHVIYASGEQAGTPGVENAEEARRWAEADGVLAGTRETANG
jgi:hypothetical protein